MCEELLGAAQQWPWLSASERDQFHTVQVSLQGFTNSGATDLQEQRQRGQNQQLLEKISGKK